jgi:hypothetical protein
MNFAVRPGDASCRTEPNTFREAPRELAETHGLVAQGNESLQVIPARKAIERQGLNFGVRAASRSRDLGICSHVQNLAVDWTWQKIADGNLTQSSRNYTALMDKAFGWLRQLRGN